MNIAARLESLAEPGGTCVSRAVRDHVRKQRRYSFIDIGFQTVKNIAEPVDVWVLVRTAVSVIRRVAVSVTGVVSVAVTEVVAWAVAFRVRVLVLGTEMRQEQALLSRLGPYVAAFWGGGALRLPK